MSRTTRLAALLTVALLLSACTGPPGTDLPPSTTKSADRVVHIGVGTDIPGFGLFDPVSQKRSGFDVSLYLWLAYHSSARFTPVEHDVTIATRPEALRTGKVRLVVDVYSITDERRKAVSFAGPYLTTRQGVLVRAGDTSVRKVEDLAGKHVCAQTGSTSLLQLNNSNLNGRITVTEEVGSRGCVNRLIEGTVDAASTDELVLHGYAKAEPDKVAVVPDLTFGAQERYGIGLPHGDTALCEEVSNGLREFLSSGEWESFFRENFPALNPEDHKPSPTQLDPCP